MDEALLQIATGGIFAILILREVFGFIKNGNNKEFKITSERFSALERKICENNKLLRENKELLYKILGKINDLWHWHSMEDPATGVKIWYNTAIKNKLNEIYKYLEEKLT